MSDSEETIVFTPTEVTDDGLICRAVGNWGMTFDARFEFHEGADIFEYQFWRLERAS